MRKFGQAAALSAILIAGGVAGATNALAADMDSMVTKAPVVPPPPPGPVACNSLAGFFLSDCQLLWYGIRLYGTVDLGGTYQTNGTPFDKNFPTGASYLLQKPSRQSGFGLAPNGMSQSVVGVDIKEPVASDWAFVARGELAFDPLSGLLANAPQAMQDAIHVPLNQQEIPVELQPMGLVSQPDLCWRQFAGLGHAHLRPTKCVGDGRCQCLRSDGRLIRFFADRLFWLYLRRW